MDSPVKLIRRRGWIAVQKAEVALLIEQCGERAPTVCMTWLALLTIANDRRTGTFKVGVNVIRHLAGPSLRTVKSALYKLAELDFIKAEPNHIPGSKERDANTYTLLRGQACNKSTTHRANDRCFPLHRTSEQTANACEESVSACELKTAGIAADAGQPSSHNGIVSPRKW